jgi:Zn-dependent protease
MDLNGLFRFPLDQLPFVVLVLVIAFTVHEFAHAYSAYKFGDPTAYQLGRVTLNPMAHLDIFGTLLLLIAGFGWAKPVPVNRSRFKNPRLMGIVVSAVGPLSNFVLAFIGVFFIYMFAATGWLAHMSAGSATAIHLFLSFFVQINLTLFLFNLIPIPPLDGYRILQDILPLRANLKLQQFEQWASIIFLLFVFIPPLRRVTLDPLFSLQIDIFNMFLIPLRWIFGPVS